MSGHLPDDPFDFEAEDEQRVYEPREPESAPAQRSRPNGNGAMGQTGPVHRHKAPNLPPLDVTYPSRLEGDPPPREWLVPGWIPSRTVTMLSGDGGVGKSLLAMQLMTACATGRDWLGRRVEQCPAFGVFCEDEDAELWRRQDGIDRLLGVRRSDYEDMAWVSRVGEDNALVEFERYEGKMTALGFYQQIHNQAQDMGARCIVLDALHDLYPGNENDRVQVRRFVNLLAQLAKDCDGAVILCAHPSEAGIASGSGKSGSTAWHNAVRSRLYLTRRKDDDGEDSADDRVLSKKKANYGTYGETIALHWKDGAFEADVPAQGIFATIIGNQAEQAFLEGMQELERRGVNVSMSPHAANFAPKQIAKLPAGRKFTTPDLRKAMDVLFHQGSLEVEYYGREQDKGSRKRRLVLSKQPKSTPGGSE